jgi:hypothetical protein
MCAPTPEIRARFAVPPASHPARTTQLAHLQGFEKRMKGLEPSTFCRQRDREFGAGAEPTSRRGDADASASDGGRGRSSHERPRLSASVAIP